MNEGGEELGQDPDKQLYPNESYPLKPPSAEGKDASSSFSSSSGYIHSHSSFPNFKEALLAIHLEFLARALEIWDTMNYHLHVTCLMFWLN